MTHWPRTGACTPTRSSIGGVTVLRAAAAPSSPMLNRIVGLGVDEPATRGRPRRGARRDRRRRQLLRGGRPGGTARTLADWLRERGLEPGWGWMAFRRGVDDLPDRRPRSASSGSGRRRRTAFGRIVATGYGLPDAAVPWAASAHEAGWDCWLALDGDEPAAAAGCLRRRGCRLSRLRRDAPRAPRQGRPERAPRGTDPARPRGRLRRRRDRDRRAPRRPARRTRTATSSAPGFTEVAVTANWLRPAAADASGEPGNEPAAAAGSARPSARGA